MAADESPQFFITELMMAATQMHEAFTAYMQAGFTEAQAFELVRTIRAASIGGAS